MRRRIYAPAPVYYSGYAGYAAPYYVAPAAIGLGIGYWVGSDLAQRLPLRLARRLPRLALRPPPSPS